MSKSNPSIEDLLINPEDKGNQQQLSRKIQDIKIQDKEYLTKQKAYDLNIPYINLVGFPIPSEALSILDAKEAKQKQAIAFFFYQGQIRLAVVNPHNPEIIELADRLAKNHKADIKIYLTSKHSLEAGLKLYEALPKIKKIDTGVNIDTDSLLKWQKEITDFTKLQQVLTDVNLTEIITIILASALKTKSSDVHIEVEETDIKVRFRIDGMLHTVASLPHNLWKKIVSRIKLVSGLKLNISSLPQDGRFTINIGENKVEVRTATAPTAYGESVVMRLLQSSAVSLNLENLGMRPEVLEILQKEINKPNGMIVSTGPTGSGKTTSLYAILNKLNSEENKIITLEDPIEYKLKGINQSQIEKDKGYTYAKGLISILRQDPDIVMVGEIRDKETMEIAINAALTGHLLISTLHTNSAAGAIPRFLAMDAKPFLLSPSLNAVIGQRLVRKLCEHCKKPITLDKETENKVKEKLKLTPEYIKKDLDFDNLKFYDSEGCEKCHHLGYKGRIGIFEVMTMNQEIDKLTLSGQATEYQIEKIAVKNGMLTMVQDGLLKASQGITSVEEVFKKAE